MGGGWVTTADKPTTTGARVPLERQIEGQPVF
jgi:hypothetical protein